MLLRNTHAGLQISHFLEMKLWRSCSRNHNCPDNCKTVRRCSTTTTQKIFVPDSTQNTNSSQNLKSSEQEYNFFFCFFLPTPPRGPCALASGIVALRVVPESKSLTSSSKQGGRRLFGANSTATHATPKSSEKEEVFVSSFSAHQWENQPPKKQKTKKPANLWNFALQSGPKKNCVTIWVTTSVVLVSGFADTKMFLVSIFYILKSR